MLPVTNTAELREQLSILDGWYERLGEAGQDFIKTFKRLNTEEHFDPDHGPIAAFYGVGLTTFTDAIIYGPKAVANDLHALFSNRTHEIIHAMQAYVCAATHADPVNKRTSVILCPRDYIKLELLKERGAYAGQSLFNTLIHRLDTGKAEKISLKFSDLADPANASEIERIRSNMRRHIEELFADPRHDLQKRYAAHALDRYELAMADDRSKEVARGELRFVRLEAEDIAAAGDGFVFNIFTDENDAALKEYMDAIELPPEIEERVQALNRLLGIDDESMLPTFGTALAASDSDREQFLVENITGVPSVPVLFSPPQKPPPGPAPL